MAKYKVGDIFINHKDGKILQICKGNYCKDCCYNKTLFKIDFKSVPCHSIAGASCYSVAGLHNHFKELPFLPIGTKVKVREDLKVGIKYGDFIFNLTMKQYKEVTIKSYSYRRYDVSENNYMYSLEMFDQVINEPKENNNMETKEIKINVPEGYEIDKENSTFECVKFKPVKKELTYEDVVEELFSNSYYYVSGCCKIVTGPIESKYDKNNATNKKQLEKLLALNQLLNIAEYYNKKSPIEGKSIYSIKLDEQNSKYLVSYCNNFFVRGLIPMFNRYKDAKAVIENPNFKAILDIVYEN